MGLEAPECDVSKPRQPALRGRTEPWESQLLDQEGGYLFPGEL